MKPFHNRSIGPRVRKVGANAVTFLLALAVPPQAANAVLYLTGDSTSPESSIWKRMRLILSNHVINARRTNTHSENS
ncbi:MAG: hypothetical protein LAO21_20110 [Acidobacteriia bacterium]|nr:hypothetical protein [Terriglobia bacterium]